MLEKRFLEEIRRGKEADLEMFGADVCDLLDWGISNNFVEGISYLGFGGKVSIQYTNPRLTAAGEDFLLALEKGGEEVSVKVFDTDALIDKIKVLDEDQKEVIERLADNIQLLEEVKSLDEDTISAMKKILLNMRFEDKDLPWDTLTKLIFMIKGNS